MNIQLDIKLISVLIIVYSIILFLAYKKDQEETKGNICPACGKNQLKVIYAGFPMKLCENNKCSTLTGFWSFIPTYILPFNGWFYVYEGSYIKALWKWLKGEV